MKYDYKDVLMKSVGNYQPIIQAITNLPDTVFNKKGQPCPMCGGKDRFRYTDRSGEGAYVCRGCGGGSGIDLIMKSTGMEFGEVIDSAGDYLMMIPVKQREINRTRAIAKAAMPSYAKMHEDDANTLLSKCVDSGIGYWLKLNSVTKLEFPLLNKADSVIPIVDNIGTVINAALVQIDGQIQYCGQFTYGGFGLLGDDNGKHRYMCVDLIDALIVHEYTGSQVLWVGRIENYHPVFNSLNEDEKARMCAASNWLLDEFQNINGLLRKYDSVKVILPPQGRSIQSSRKLTRYLYDPEVFLKNSEHGFEF